MRLDDIARGPDPTTLERGDIEGAVRMYRELMTSKLSEDKTADTVAILLQLQDDPDELLKRFDAVDAELKRAG